MKIGKVILGFIGLIAVAMVAGFGYFAIADVPVAQTEISKEIPHDRFSQ